MLNILNAFKKTFYVY
jgi:hypothetical protein